MRSLGFTRRTQRWSTKDTKRPFETFVHPFVVFVSTIIFLFPSLISANNLQLSNLQQVAPDQLNLEIAWDHSWNLPDSVSPGNHDAVWLFVKIRDANGLWHHADLATDSSLHGADAGLTVKPVSDGMGVFVRRMAQGSGTVSGMVSIRLNQAVGTHISGIRIHGIEMVYVPEGPFFLGDGQQFHHFRQRGSSDPFYVDSENLIPQASISVGDTAELGSDIPAAFPKGFGAFYAMKYEISQEQYAAFLNTLTYDQQAARTEQSPDSPTGTYALSTFNPLRNGIVISRPGVAGAEQALYASNADGDNTFDEATDGQNRACNFLSWLDVLAYLDWAGLRPLTELEFEKLCRGPEVPVSGEFAWGTSKVVDANTILLDGTAGETVSETATPTAGLASHGYFGPSGPLRNGFGGTDSSNRLQIGAGFYGATELSGNLWESCVSVRAAGLMFSGIHGDGSLDATGSVDVSGWPLTEGGILRGGAHNSGIVGEFRDLAVSDRFYHDLHPSQRRNTTGGRGGRSSEF